jgi:arylsulfatase B
MDATATALDLAKVETGKAGLDGRDLLPLLTGKLAAEMHDTLFWRVGRKNALRHGDWKLIRDGGAWQLYDLAHDVSETTNLAAQNASRVTELSALWDKWNGEQIEPLWK